MKVHAADLDPYQSALMGVFSSDRHTDYSLNELHNSRVVTITDGSTGMFDTISPGDHGAVRSARSEVGCERRGSLYRGLCVPPDTLARRAQPRSDRANRIKSLSTFLVKLIGKDGVNSALDYSMTSTR